MNGFEVKCSYKTVQLDLKPLLTHLSIVLRCNLQGTHPVSYQLSKSSSRCICRKMYLLPYYFNTGVVIQLPSNTVREGESTHITLAAPQGSEESSIGLTFQTVAGSAAGEGLW